MAAMAPASSGGESVIREVEMNGGTDQAAGTVRVTVVQAASVFYDTPATLGACSFAPPLLSL
jgi:nitrilase